MVASNILRKWSPISLLSLAAIAQGVGHEVIIVNSEAEHFSIQQVVDNVENFEPHLIRNTAITPFFILLQLIL
jgi:hypothetical protein